MASGVSLLKPLGYQTNKSCGYCKSSQGSSSYYLSSSGMRLDHYQELMNRGWRRSGTTYYKQDLPRSCCPHYTIRLEAKHFKPKKEQRQAVNHMNSFVLGPEYKRKVAMLSPQSREEKRKKRDKFELIEAVHIAEYQMVKRPVGRKSKAPIEPAHKLEVSLESDSFTKEKHKIMVKYQTQIHKDPASRWSEASFKRFLCDGLNREILKIQERTMKLGSYHQCYRLDGKLVAVAVLDLLPSAVSSVYLFYDPDYQHLDFGKLSAMREIALAIEGGYDFYYMGFYIHSCIKMRYKGNFEPSHILDPETLEWDPLDDDFRRKLDKRKYVSLSSDRKLGEPNAEGSLTSNIVTAIEQSDDAHTTKSKETSSSINANESTDNYELDSDPSDQEDTEIPEGSLFDYNIPGILTKDQTQELDLDHWKLFIRNVLVDLEDIRGWETQSIDDPTSIKGIVAELAAAIGPQVLQNSAVVLF